jgi:hypothetical protein
MNRLTIAIKLLKVRMFLLAVAIRLSRAGCMGELFQATCCEDKSAWRARRSIGSMRPRLGFPSGKFRACRSSSMSDASGSRPFKRWRLRLTGQRSRALPRSGACRRPRLRGHGTVAAIASGRSRLPSTLPRHIEPTIEEAPIEACCKADGLQLVLNLPHDYCTRLTYSLSYT